MYSKIMMLALVGAVLIGPAVSDDDDRRFLFARQHRPGPIRQFLRPLIGRPLIGGGRIPIQGGGIPIQGGGIPIQGVPFGGGSAAGLGSGAVQNGQAIGTGTGIANPGPGGFGIGLGIGAAVATPIGNFAVGDGSSISVGK